MSRYKRKLFRISAVRHRALS